jgi:hypothetical protein
MDMTVFIRVTDRILSIISVMDHDGIACIAPPLRVFLIEYIYVALMNINNLQATGSVAERGVGITFRSWGW